MDRDCETPARGAKGAPQARSEPQVSLRCLLRQSSATSVLGVLRGKRHKHGGSMTDIESLTVLETGSPRSVCGQGWSLPGL